MCCWAALRPLMRSTFLGSTEPSTSCWPTTTFSPSSTRSLGALAHLVGDVLVAVVAHDGEATQTLAILHLEAAGGLGGDRRACPRGTSLEKLLDSRKTLGDVISRCGSTGVDGTHRQLGTGLTNRLGSNDTNGLADVDELAGGHRAAVALAHGVPIRRLKVRTERTLTSLTPAAMSLSMTTSSQPAVPAATRRLPSASLMSRA